ncbi:MULTISPECIES: hypothetical protein [Virgibacillus]|nr:MULTISPECIES: hypothetical protein [Virgibacillus]EQB39039.1 hypothetical protein M948_01425 [Virgibacillus sp. CM-4]
MMNDKQIYILLTDTGTWFTKLIKCYTRKPYNHASIAFDEELEKVYSFGRKKRRNPFIGGFIKEDIQTGLFKQASGAIYSFTITNEQWNKMNAYVQEIQQEQDNYRYNLLGVFGILLQIPIKRRNAFFCSQFVATVLKKSNVIEYHKPPALITPHDLLSNEVFELVYKGKLKAYQKERLKSQVDQDFGEGREDIILF